MVRDVVEGLEKEQAWEAMIPLLQDLLNYSRQQLNRNEMDRLYDKLEQALEATKDEDRLVRTCHSHLEIKRAIGDVEGEERLLSKLGRLHHRRERALRAPQTLPRLAARRPPAQSAPRGP